MAWLFPTLGAIGAAGGAGLAAVDAAPFVVYGRTLAPGITKGAKQVYWKASEWWRDRRAMKRSRYDYTQADMDAELTQGYASSGAIIDSSNGQWRQKKRKWAPMGRVTREKILRTLVERTVFRWQQISPSFAVGRGKMGLDCMKMDDTAGTKPPYSPDCTLSAQNVKFLPYYVWDLTAVPNIKASDSSTVYLPYVSWRLGAKQDTVDGITQYYYRWFPTKGQGSGGGSSPNLIQYYSYQTEQTDSNTFASSHNTRRCVLDWVDVSLNVYGARTAPTVVYVDVIQFPDGYGCPLGGASTLSSAATPIAQNMYFPDIDSDNFKQECDMSNWWNQALDKAVTNPIMHFGARSGGAKSQPRILRRQTIVIDPANNFEEDSDGHKRTVHIRLPVGRQCNYLWNRGNTLTGTAGDITDGAPDFNTISGYYDCYVDPKARLFLRVWAKDYVGSGLNTDPLTESTVNHASFDIMIRKQMLSCP